MCESGKTPFSMGMGKKGTPILDQRRRREFNSKMSAIFSRSFLVCSLPRFPLAPPLSQFL